MTNRERAMRILTYKPVDRLPAVHFGYWNELLWEWAEQGHISRDIAAAWGDGNEADRELNRVFGWDFGWSRLTGANMGLSPTFEEKVLEVLPDGFQRVQNRYGIIERLRPGAGSIPSEDDYLLKDREAFLELYLPKMMYAASRVNKDAILRYCKDVGEDAPHMLNLGSVLGEIRNMMSVIGMSYMLGDDYDLFGEIVTAYADMQYACVKEALESGADIDVGHYWEDICFKNGPLISPTMFEDLCAEHYKKRNDLCHEHGIQIISLDCDGVTEKLLPVWFESGVNTMFPIEVGVWGDQFAPAREKFGKGMLGVGGMNKVALREDRDAVNVELARMQKLVDLGGFLPCPDHRLMPGTKFELVQYYAEEVRKLRPYQG